VSEVIKKNRLLTLDYLRGFFIIVIIIDHLSRWPSALSIFTGQAWLWVTAAEGFVIISGLLVGYVRGHKNKTLPMRTVTTHLLKRSLLLYVWSVIGTFVYVAIVWYISFKGGAPATPMDIGDWPHLISETLTLQYTWVWLHFLTLYAIFLAAAPCAVWLFRHGRAWAVALISFLLLILGWQTHTEALQWQVLFFIPSIAGFHLEDIQKAWKSLARRRRAIFTWTIWILTGLTIATSAAFTFIPGILEDIGDKVGNGYFNKDTISIWRLLMAFLWFGGFILLFAKFDSFISKYLGRLLLPFGTRSLTAYILHGLALSAISFVTVSGGNIIVNTLLGGVAIGIVWILLQLPFVQKIVPR
jgi:hypothetical protein